MKNLFKKIGVGVMIVIFMSVTFGTPIVQGLSVAENYDLVALLVEQGMYRDEVDYDGLVGTVQSNQIWRTTNTMRVNRYAADIQRSTPGTRVIVVQVDRYEKPENVRTVLQRLYFDGDPQGDGGTAILKGVVAIGDVPLPVVNKSGNRFISLFPYTDLDNSAYVFNDTTGDFEPNSAVSDPRVEVWHGVIRPPVSTATEDGRKLLSAYLDKNHLYHIGDSAYATFDKRLFFQDFFHEKKQINKTAFKSYLQFLNHQDDISYMRYTKKLFQELSGAIEDELADAGQESADLRAQLEAEGIEFDDSVPQPDIETPGADAGPPSKNDIPDILTKAAKMSDALMKKYTEIFSKYPNLVNDFVRYTGRYYVPNDLTPDETDYRSLADSSVTLIATKDDYTRGYLRVVNDMIERKIDEVAARLQRNISFGTVTLTVKSVSATGLASLEGEVVPPYSKSDNAAAIAAIDTLKTGLEATPLEKDALIDKAKQALQFIFFTPSSAATKEDIVSFSTNYLNYVPAVAINDLAYFPEFFGTYPLDDDPQYTKPKHINGVQWDDITSVEQCTLLRGSLGSGSYSKLVEANRALDVNTAKGSTRDQSFPALTDLETKADYKCDDSVGNTGEKCEAFEHFGGCYYDGTGLYENPDSVSKYRQCYVDDATNPVLDLAGTRAITEKATLETKDTGYFTGYDDYRACLNFRPEYAMYKQRAAVDQIHEKLDDNTQGRTREEILATAREMIDGGLDIPDSDPAPDQQVLFKSKAPRVTVTLGDLLRGYIAAQGPQAEVRLDWDSRNNFADWKVVFAKLIPPAGNRNYKIMLKNHAMREARVEISRTNEKEISSIRVHKEPTKQTLIAQGDGFIAKELPVDEPRYITFQDKNHELVSITYPDVFSAKNYDEFIEQVRAVEAQLNVHELMNGQPRERACEDCLTSLFVAAADQSPEVNQEQILTRANKYKLADALTWKDLDIDSRHVYMAENYLDSQHTAYMNTGREKGYEISYFNGEGDAQGYDLGFNQELNATATPALQEVEKAYNDDPANPFDYAPEPQEQGGYDLFTWNPPPVSPWYERVKEWYAKLDDNTSFTASFGADKQKKSEEQAKELEVEKEQIKLESAAFAASPQNADSIQLSRVAKVRLSAESTAAVVLKKVPFTVELLDEKGALVSTEFNRISLAVTGGARIADTDEDPTTEGTQRTIIGGKTTLSFIAPEKAGTVTVNVSVADRAEVRKTLTFSILKSATLSLGIQQTAIVADGRGVVPVVLTAIDDSGRPLTTVSGTVHIALSDDTLARATKEVSLVGGRAQFMVRGGVKKGELILNATISNLDPASATINFLPGPAVKLVLAKSAEVLVANPGESIDVTAQIFDANNNLIDTNSGTPITFALDQQSQEIAELAAQSVVTRDGLATVRISPKGRSGAVTITAQAQGLRNAEVSFDTVKKFGTGSLSRIVPESLVSALLGIPAGNVRAPNAFGASMVFSGKVQAVTTLTTSPKQYAKVFEVSDKAALTTDPDRVSVSFVPGNHLTFLLRDTRYGIDLAKVFVITKKDGQFALTTAESPEKLSDGIYLHAIKNDPAYVFDTARGALRISKSDEDRIEVQRNGFVKIYDQNFTVRPKKAEYLTLEILEGGNVIAEVFIVQRFNQDVRTYKTDAEISNNAAGVYVKPFALPGTFFFEPSFAGNTSSASLGMALKDRAQVLDGAGTPGFGYNSFEDSLDSMGVGFTQDNKFALLFAAGESFGEANRPYMSDATIVLGDPTVKLATQPVSGDFTTDVGNLLYAAKSDVRGLLSFDVNSDGFEDVLIVQQDGLIQYLQNGGGVNDFTDRGTLLNIKNGIQDFTKVDINNDGQQDIVVAAKDGCTADSTCIDIFLNSNGKFTRQNVSFNQSEKITSIKAADMNGDRLNDLIFTDTAGDLSILYNVHGGFTTNKTVIGNVGLKTDPSTNIISNTLVRYAGIVERNPNGPQDETEARNQAYYKSIELSIPNPEAANRARSSIDAVNPVKKVTQDFMYADAPISKLLHSTKFALDINGGVLRNGDLVRYTIALRNNTNAPISRVAVVDVVGSQIQLNNDSMRCTNCAQGEMVVTPLTEDPERPVMFSNITIPPMSSRVITYEGIFTQSVDVAEKVTIVINNFTDSKSETQRLLSADELPDISINKEGNTSGRVQYFISKKENGRVSYEQAQSTVEPDAIAGGSASALATMATAVAALTSGEVEEVPQAVTDKFNEFKGGDKDGDGLQDMLDDINGDLEKVADNVEGIVNKLTCSAGCIPLPINMAALAPGFFSVMGVPGTFDIGLPAFGWGVPSLIPTWPPSGPAQAAAGGRFYVSPTLTGGVGFGLCLGTYGSPKNCYAFGLNPLDLLPGNICDTIGGGLNKLVAKANSVTSKINEGVTASLSPRSAGGGTRGGTGLVSYSMGNYEPPVPNKRHSRVPGFPSFITDWWSAQIEEIVDKATDLPDIYVIYPKITSIANSVIPTEAFNRTNDPINNILSWVNSIPLIDIQSSEVNFKVPIITEKEIAKLKIDALQWVEDEKAELKRWQNMMLCGVPLRGEDASISANERAQFMNVEICNLVELEMNKLISSVLENVKRLDEWVLFPKKVLQYRTIKTYYVNQVVDYLNTIIQFVGGWVKRNTAIIERWRKSIREMKDVIENYKLIVKLSMDANASCDLCKTERYGLDELILKIFAAIPKPPVIPLPKLPDFVIDVSKIQAGITLQWPDITFAPEPLTIPKLPRIKLGINLTLPQFKLMVPEIPLLPMPPDLPDLPQLPPLQLGKLPDLPPAPTLPDLPASLQATLKLLSQLYRIYCIIKLGFTPVDELFLKTRIEQITARGLTPVLPIDTLLAFQGPSIQVKYVDQIVVTAFLNLRTDMSFIQRAVEAVAEKSNQFTNEFVSKINKFTDNLSKALEQYTSPTIDINVNADGSASSSVNGPARGFINALPKTEKDKYSDILSQVFGEKVQNVEDANAKLSQTFSTLSKEQREYEAQLNDIPQKYVLTAEPISLDQAKVSLSNAKIEPVNIELLADQSPTLKQIVAYRDQLSKFAEGTSTETLSLSQLIAEGSATTPENPFVRATASLTTPRVSDEPQKVASLVREDDQTRIAQVPAGLDGVDPAAGGDEQGSINNVGIFYQDSLGVNRRLLNYTLEAASSNFLETLDADKDGDSEKIYSYGRNIYIKENFSRKQNGDEREKFERHVFTPYDIEQSTVYELLKGASAPRDIRVVSESAHDSTLSFTVPELQKQSVLGFDVTTHATLYDAQANGPRTPKTVTRYVLDTPVTPTVSDPKNPVVATVSSVEGLVKASGTPVGVGTSLQTGSFISVGDSAELSVAFNDGTRIDATENAGFSIPESSSFILAQGKAQLILSETSNLFKEGMSLSVVDGSLTVVLLGGSSVTIPAGGSFTIPHLEKAQTVLSRVTDATTVIGSTRDYISRSTGTYHLNPGDRIHPLSQARVRWAIESDDEHVLTLRDVILSVPDSAQDGIDISVEEGEFEIIHTKVTGPSPIRSKSVLLPNEKVEVRTGAAVVETRVGDIKNGALLDVDARRSILYAGQALTLNSFDSLDSVSLTVRADPAFYYARISSFLADGTASVTSATTLLAPQPCGDTTAPYANAGSSEMTVAVGKELTIDASRSFDANGTILGYQLDTNIAVDSDRDGDPKNDADQKHAANQSSFIVGPYTDPADITVLLTVLDEAKNAGTQAITIHVVQPSIVLEREPLLSGTIAAHIEPKEANVPIVIARLRADGSAGWELIKTPSANQDGQYMTDAHGEFRINDTTSGTGLTLYVSDMPVAVIDQKTGRITVTDPTYEVRALPAVAGVTPTRLSVFKKGEPSTAKPYAFVYFVPDVNTDVTIDSAVTAYTRNGVSSMSGVHVKPLAKATERGMKFSVLPGSDAVNPGGVALTDSNKKRIALIDVNGDILLSNPSLSLRVKAVDNPRTSPDPVVFELLENNSPIAEICIVTKGFGKADVSVITTPTVPLRPRPVSKKTPDTPAQKPVNEQPFIDIQKNDPFNTIIKKLYERGIVAGYETQQPGVFEFKPEQQIARSEFTQIILKMLCIVPRAEAYRLPTPFYDVVDTRQWFYAVLKEGNLRGFIKGYLLEGKREKNTGELLTPFKPANSITRGEAATVVLAALDEQGVIDLQRADLRPQRGDQWYDPYVRVSLNLTPYLTRPEDVFTRTFLLTPDEAVRPTELITRRDFALMADRVLLLRDCGKPAENNAANGADTQTPADGVGQNNQSGAQGQNDAGSNNNGGGDTTPDAPPRVENTEGIFVVDGGCSNVCPCRSRIAPSSDLASGDTIFAAIAGPNGTPIYAKSNEEKYR